MNITVTGNLGDLSKEIFSIKTKGENTFKVLGIIADEIRQDVIQNFRGEHNPYGQRWKELTSYTKKEKAKRGQRSEILQADGYLIDEMSSKANYPISGNNLDVITKSQGDVEDGDNPFYGYKHNFGEGVSERKFVAYTDKINKNVEDRVFKLFND